MADDADEYQLGLHSASLSVKKINKNKYEDILNASYLKSIFFVLFLF